jgi:hypothetical protein
MFFIVAALTKRALQDDKMKAGDRLHLLEKLNGLTDQNFTADQLALIDPMSDLEYQIFCEAKSLDIKAVDLSPAQQTQASYDILTGYVFEHFVVLNPGMAKAIRWGPRRPATVPQTTAPDGSALRPASDDGPERYHIHSVPTQNAGPASIYDASGRLWPQHEREREQYANGTPNNNPINPHTGR